jgi:hypothetical protein
MTTVRRFAFALACLAAPIMLHAQHTISGTVKSDAGQPIDGANVYMNDLAISVLTNGKGEYVITVPAERIRDVLIRAGRDSVDQRRVVDSFRITVRARAVRHTPGAFPVTIRAGVRAQTLNIVLRSDGSSAPDRVPVPAVAGAERARVPFAVARGEQLTTASIPGNDDALARFLFSPELVMQHQDALGLSESQRKGIQGAIHETQTTVLRVQWELSYEGEKLSKLLAAETLDEVLVLSVVDRIMGMERDIKRAHMTLLVRIRNMLHPTQQAKLRELRQGNRE